MKQLLHPIPLEEHFVPALALRRGLSYFMKRFHFALPMRGHDDLDEYQVLLLETDGTRFLLLKYEGAPEDTVNVFIPERMRESPSLLGRIVRELDVPPEAVVTMG